MDERIELKKETVDLVSKIQKKSNVCIKDVLSEFTIFGYISSGYFGDVYAMGFGKDKRYTGTSYTSAAKTKRVPKFVMKVTFNSKENMNEVKVLKNTLNSMWNQTPHIPLYYKHFTCDKTLFRGDRKQGVAKSYLDWDWVKNGKSIILMMEYVGKSMDQFLSVNKDPSVEIVMLLQMLYTIHVMQHHKIVHGDLYVSNLTFMKSGKDENKVWEYKVGSESYMVPIGEYIPVLIDFGQAVKGEARMNDYSSNDAYVLMKNLQRQTNHDVVYKFMKNITSKIYDEETNKMTQRYTQSSKIIKDFFPMFLKKSKHRDAAKLWKIN